ncbi:MAG: hypothetical protein GX086_12685 [Alcaligenaceae bacterium]|nr:hypothetical protein [Alcaligenaceae bacterium]
MFYAALKTLHVLSIIVWVGGMVFAHFYLRPSVAMLEPPVRLRLMADVLGRFFRDVLGAALIAVATGIWMIGRTARAASEAGVVFQMPVGWHIMSATGVLMLLIFLGIRFRLYPKLVNAVSSADYEVAGRALASIRGWVSVNLVLGVVTVIVALAL